MAHRPSTERGFFFCGLGNISLEQHRSHVCFIVIEIEAASAPSGGHSLSCACQTMDRNVHKTTASAFSFGVRLQLDPLSPSGQQSRRRSDILFMCLCPPRPPSPLGPFYGCAGSRRVNAEQRRRREGGGWSTAVVVGGSGASVALEQWETWQRLSPAGAAQPGFTLACEDLPPPFSCGEDGRRRR